MIRVVCDCGRVFKAEDRHAGKRTKCPVCGTSLTIGEATVPSSSGGDIDEVPSWWYPADPEGQSPPGPITGQGVRGNDALATAVFNSNPDLSHLNVPGNQSRLPVTASGSHQTSPRSISRVRRLWALSAGTAILAILALGAIVWMRSIAPVGVGERPESQTATDPSPPPQVPDSNPRPSDPPATSPGKTDPTASRTSPARVTRRLRLLVPAYIFPGGNGLNEWQRIFAAASKAEIVAIANPNSGPGAERNPAYFAIIAEAKQQGVKVIGYISTEYARRSSVLVKSQIDSWIRLYPDIVGFFFDQQSPDSQHVAYYSEIRTYARSKLPNALVITNPGVPCDEAYFAKQVSDVTCVFAYFQGFGGFEIPADLKAYELSRFAALAYKVPDVATMREVIKDAVFKKIGYIYVTDGTPPNQWGKLPSYWEDEVAAISRNQ